MCVCEREREKEREREREREKGGGRETGRVDLSISINQDQIDDLAHCLEGGKESLTEFERLSFNGLTSVVLARPHTGRMHQIRVHLQFMGNTWSG